MADHDDLDDILDSALDDFRNVHGLQSNQRSLESSSSSQESFPADSRASPSEKTTMGQGLGVGLPALTPGKRKTASTKGNNAMHTGKTTSSAKAAAVDARVSATDTLEQLAQQTRQTLEGLETDMDDDAMGEKLVEDLVKQFEELGGSQDMHSMMDVVMRQLLSKEVLHEPMKEIGARYPDWLESNKSKLSNKDYSRYSRQYELIKQLCIVYETNADDFQRIVDIMQRMQDCGQPPSDIVQELNPGLDLGADGLPILSELFQDGNPGTLQNQNCSIM